MDWQFTPKQKMAVNGHLVWSAKGPADLSDVDDLWRAIYGRELGWLAPNGKSLHNDRFHAHSVYLLARVDGQTVGTMRLVRDSAEGLPVEQFVPIEKLRGDGDRRLIECQRLMILPEYRNQRRPDMPYGVLAALVKGCLHWSLRNAVTHVVADLFLNTPTTPMAQLKALGFVDTGLEFVDTELTEPDRSAALLLTVGDLFARAYVSDQSFYRYLMASDEIIDVYE